MFNFSKEMQNLHEKVMQSVGADFAVAEQVMRDNQRRMLQAFIENKVSTSHLVGTTGYGYNDIGRDKLCEVFAQVVGTEDALLRHNFMSGTHAITVALFALLRPGDTLLYASGAPYDTLHKAIGTADDGTGSLCDFGVLYEELPLQNGDIDIDAVTQRCKQGGVKVVALQRSCGYAGRPSLSVEKLEQAAAAVKAVDERIYVFVDNCYGEFVEMREPSHNIDLIAGSLIKNAGGGIASTGGYIAGTAHAVELAANRLSVPGIGAEIGSTGGALRELYLGLYFAPSVVCEAVKTAVYACALFDELGYTVRPHVGAERTDILAAIDTKSAKTLVAICEAVQACSPVDSFVTPVAAPMPGYADEVIMAAGAFTAGSSIEISCDGPLREPFTAFLQGGLNFEASRLALLSAAEKIKNIT